MDLGFWCYICYLPRGSESQRMGPSSFTLEIARTCASLWKHSSYLTPKLRILWRSWFHIRWSFMVTRWCSPLLNPRIRINYAYLSMTCINPIRIFLCLKEVIKFFSSLAKASVIQSLGTTENHVLSFWDLAIYPCNTSASFYFILMILFQWNNVVILDACWRAKSST